MNNNIGENIKTIRKTKGLTQKQLGQLLGVSQAAIGQFKSGKSNLTIDTIKKIADALGVTEWHIMYGMIDEEVLEKMRNNRKEYAKRFKEKTEAEENGLLENYRSLTKEGKQKVQEYAHDLKGNPDYRNAASADEPADPDKAE